MPTPVIKASGPIDAKVLVVGEFPTVEAERRLTPFHDTEGAELTKMLHEAGFLWADLRIIYLCNFRPFASKLENDLTNERKHIQAMKSPGGTRGKYTYSTAFAESAKTLIDEINRFQPNLIITLGPTPLWFLTGEESVSNWRGSTMAATHEALKPWRAPQFKLIPTYSPAQIFRVWEWRPFAVRDLQRACAAQHSPEIPTQKLDIQIRPTFSETTSYLTDLLRWLDSRKEPAPIACDIETTARQISCIGFAWNTHSAICIPLRDSSGHYFTLDEEVEVVWRMRQLLLHPMAQWVGQNFSYDIQHIVRSWGVVPFHAHDTMLAQHVCFPGIPKDLGFLASLYCEHYVYWKDELTDYNRLPENLEMFWRYNGKDCIHTLEIHFALQKVVEQLGFCAQYAFLMELQRAVTQMMLRGVRMNRQLKDELGISLLGELCVREEEINFLLGSEVNIGSPKQMQTIFYEQMGFKPVLHKKTYRPTTDDNALKEIASREPLLRPLTKLISDTRSIGVFLSTFVHMPLDRDGRMRSSFNVGGTETFRFSSSKNAFGSGGNLQNIPKGDEDEGHDPSLFTFPNLRKLFIPDPGMTMFDVDLAGADAQVVAWEAYDDDLKAKFRSGQKIHALNAKDIFGGDAGPDGKREPYYKRAKMGVHLTNYGGKPRTLSKALGLTVHEAERFQTRWFSMHPGIKDWHDRVLHSLLTTRSVRNKFGFRRFYFDRIENLLPQALAWIPQSTVAIVINTGLVNIERLRLEGVPIQLLLQVHDSLVGQYPTEREAEILPILHNALLVPVPYDDPLTIQTGAQFSRVSWGDGVERKWADLLK